MLTVDSWQQLAAAGGCGWKHREHKGNAKVESSVNFVNLVMPQKSYWTVNTESSILKNDNIPSPIFSFIEIYISIYFVTLSFPNAQQLMKKYVCSDNFILSRIYIEGDREDRERESLPPPGGPGEGEKEKF